MKPTLELINLQTFVLTYDKSIINSKCQYKTVSEVTDIIKEIWNQIDENKQKYLAKLVAGTEYKKCL